MSTNCEKNQLKEAVNNDNLPIYNTVKVFVKNASNNILRLIDANEVKVKVLDGLTIDSVSSNCQVDTINKIVTINSNANADIHLSGTGYVHIQTKYKPLSIRDASAGKMTIIGDLMNCYYYAIHDFRVGNKEINISDSCHEFKVTGADVDSFLIKHYGLNLDTLSVAAGNLIEPLDFSILGNLNLNNLNIFACSGTGATTALVKDLISLSTLNLSHWDITGNISELSTLVNLQSLISRGSSVKGNVEDLLDGLFANGKTSGNLEVNVNNFIKYNNVVPSSVLNFTFSVNGWSENV